MLVLSATASGQDAGAPTGLQVDSTTTSTVTLSWTAPVGGTAPTAYNVYRCDEPCTLDSSTHWIAWVDQSGGTDLNLTDTNDNSDPAEAGGTSPVVAEKTYRYVVASLPGDTWSNQVTATTPATRALAAPTGLKTTATSATGITIGWTAPADDGRGSPEAYNVYRCTVPCVLGSNNWLAWVTDGTTHADTGVTSGASYRYAVAAYRDLEGAWSREIIAVAQTPTTPAAPVGLSPSGISETSITLRWGEPGDGGGTPEAYNVYRCEQTEGDPPCTPAWIAWVANGTTFTDTAKDTSPAEQGGTSPVVANSIYRYAVAAYRTGLAGNWSAVLSVKAESTLTVPSVPVDFTARGSGNRIALSWREPLWRGGIGLDGYTLYRGDGDSCDQLSEYKSGIPPATTYLEDSGVIAGRSYCYRLTASNLFGEGQPSDAQAVKAVDLGAPRDLKLVEGNTAIIGLAWTAPPEDGGGAVDGYDVYRCEQIGTDPCAPQYIAWVVDGEQYTDVGLWTGVTYRYAVDAVRANVVSERTNEVTFSPGAAVVVRPGSVEIMPVTVVDAKATTTEIISVSADAGVPEGTLFELPPMDASLDLFGVKVTSENAEESAPGAPNGLVHAVDRVLLIELRKRVIGSIEELPSAATICIPLSRVAGGIDPGSAAFYRTAVDRQSWMPMEAVHRPGMVCGAIRQFTRFAVFGRVAQESPDTDPVTPPTADGAPTALTVTSISANAIALSWTGPADDGGGPIEAYNVYRCEDAETSCELTADHWIAWVTSGTTFTDTHDDSDPAEAGGTSPLVPGTTYRYAVAAYREGEGNWSNEVTATAVAGNGDAAGGPRFAEDASIGDLVFTAGAAIEPITLPAATGGDIDETLNDGELSVYSFDPVDLPAGLTFDRFTRVMQGTPTHTLEKTDYTYWVHDDDEDYSRADSDSIGFTITILDASGNAPQLLSQADRVLLEDVSASMARSMLSSVVPTIGSRFVASNNSRFALAGRQLTLGEMAEQLSGDIGRATLRSENSGFSGRYGSSPTIHRIGERPYIDALSGVPGGEGVAGHQVMGGDRLLLGSGFSTRLAGELESARQWMVWGQSDIQSFQSGSADGGTYSGDVRTGYLGLDGRAGERALFGVAISHSLGQAEYAGSESAGNMQMEVTTVLPYARFKPDRRSEAWIVLGAGRGERQTFVEGQLHESGALAPKLGALGGRRTFESGIAGIDWEIRGDVQYMSLESVYDVEISAARARLGLEGSSTLQFGSDAFIRPFLELGVRYDEGAGRHTGAGVEVVAGAVFRHSRSGFWLEARGRTLLLHAAADYKESGFSLTAGMQPSADGTGPSVLISPQWGGSAEGSNAIWGDHGLNPAHRGIAMTQNERSIRSEVAWGFLAPHSGALIQPFGEMQASDGLHRRARLGARYRHMTNERQLELELSSDIAAVDSFDRPDLLDAMDWQYDVLLRGNLRF